LVVGRGFISVAVAAFALAVAAIAPAHAAKPQITPYEFSGEGVFFEGCPGGYDILIEFAGSGLNKVFFDQQGNVVRIWDWAKGEGTLINSEDPTKTETGESPNVWEWDFRDMTFTIRGMSFHNNIAGEGRVAQDTGVLVFELLSFDFETGEFETGALLHSGGKHPGFEGIDWCSMVD
jgi:hypothetical protein